VKRETDAARATGLDSLTLGLAAAMLKPSVHDGLAAGAAACLLWDAIANVAEPLARETDPERFGEYAAAAIALLRQ
jgi:hypothetical protein